MSADYSGTSVPTLNNSPASSWTTDAAKKSHVNDLYLVTGSGASAGNLYAFEEYAKPLVKNATPGDIVTFTDGGDNAPITSASVSLSPIQSLNGYDSPWPAGGGKNKLPTYRSGTVLDCSVTYSVNEDGSISANGTATGNSQLTYGECPITAGIKYRLTCGLTSGNPTSYWVRYVVRDANNAAIKVPGQGSVYIEISATTDNIEFEAPSNSAKISAHLNVSNGTTVNNIIFKPMVRLASVTDASFSPYSNICPISGHTGAELKIGSTYPTADNTYSVTFTDQGTVYGGTYDFVSGKLRVTMAGVTFNGTEAWGKGGTNQGFYVPVPMKKLLDYSRIILCDTLKTFTAHAYGNYVASDSGITGYYDSGTVYPDQNWIYAKGGGAATLAEFRAWLAENPIQVVYELATPLEYTLSPQQLTTLLGQNVVWGDAGEITQLTYTSNQFTPSFNWFETWTVPKITRDNGQVIVLPKPQEYTPEIYDVDAATTGRNAAGTMIRDRVARKHKFNYKFAALSQQDATEILNAVQDVSFTLTTASPETGAKTNYRVYVGDRSLPVYWMPTHATASWMYSSLSLNLIEM